MRTVPTRALSALADYRWDHYDQAMGAGEQVDRSGIGARRRLAMSYGRSSRSERRRVRRQSAAAVVLGERSTTGATTLT